MIENGYVGLTEQDIGPQLIVVVVIVDAVKEVASAGAKTLVVIDATEFATHVVVRQGSTIVTITVYEFV